MDLAEHGPLAEEDAELATRAAWLYHAGSLTQSQVAERLGVTSAKAHRLIARATRAGLVRVFVDGPIGNCITAEQTLSQRHGLSLCRVVPGLDDARVPLRAIAVAAAGFLRDALESGRHRVLAMGHGRTLAATVDCLPRMSVPDLQLVSLLGGLPRRVPASPFEVIDRLAEKTGAEAFMLPVPMFARRAADRAVLRAQAGVAEALELAREASLLVMGIGEASRDAFLAQSGVLGHAELVEVYAAGAVGEMLGTFFAPSGRPVHVGLHERNVTEPTSRRPGREIVAVAGGTSKVAAIAAVLNSGLLTGLITDELTARQLVALPDPPRT